MKKSTKKSAKTSATPRAGAKVCFRPTAASLALYETAPHPGTMGTVVAIPVGGKRVTMLPGPGGGVLYVEWDGFGVVGVFPSDAKPAGQEKAAAKPAEPVKAAPAKDKAPKARRNPAVESKPGLKATKASKRHLPVLSPEWREQRSARILKRNPGGSRNDPQGMRALLLQAVAKPNPVAIRENVNLSTRMMIPQLALEAESLETNLSSIDPMEYYDAFLMAGTSPDTAAARMEEMASWGVTDKV